uniref:Uncharacterized protein n=1 Tax=Parastrongyloides trichosuri TaxID=131310 RepID=A0A0N4Z8R5_PARTI
MVKRFVSCLFLIGMIILISARNINSSSLEGNGNILLKQYREVPGDEYETRPFYYNGYLIENVDPRISYKRAVGPRPLRFG